MNICMFYGRLGKDPEIRNFDGGKKKASLTLAVRGYSKNADTVWVSMTAWDKLAEICETHLKKGSAANFICRYAPSTYEKDGQKRTMHDFVIQEIEFTGSNNNNSNGGSNSSASSAKPTSYRKPASSVMNEPAEENSDLPF